MAGTLGAEAKGRGGRAEQAQGVYVGIEGIARGSESASAAKAGWLANA